MYIFFKMVFYSAVEMANADQIIAKTYTRCTDDLSFLLFDHMNRIKEYHVNMAESLHILKGQLRTEKRKVIDVAFRKSQIRINIAFLLNPYMSVSNEEKSHLNMIQSRSNIRNTWFAWG